VEFKTIGTIGAGAPARAVAAHAARAGYPVLVSNSRGPDTLGDVVAAIGPGATAATFEEAVTADLVLLGHPRVEAVERVIGSSFPEQLHLASCCRDLVIGVACV
jgi:predicted dinucleotide-binding enzyme